MAEYRLSPAAEQDLEDIWLYTFQQWGPDQAQRYVDALAASFADLSRFPKMAPVCDHVRAGYRRRSVERHMIYFRVLHERMDAARSL